MMSHTLHRLCAAIMFRSSTTAFKPSAGRPRLELGTADTIFYAIGDVHGCYDELRQLEDAIIADGDRFHEHKHIVMLGDYVDRGPCSAQVIDHLMRDLPPCFERTCLCGNHEQEMLDFIDDPTSSPHWLRLGSDATIKSYGLSLERLLSQHGRDLKGVRDALLEAIPTDHIVFLRGLASMALADDIIFVHAGLRPGIALNRQTDDDLLWIRKPFLQRGPGLPVFVIHGHTPTAEPIFHPDRIGIDTGAFRSGRLTAVRVVSRHIHLMHSSRSDGIEIPPNGFAI